MRGWGEMFEGDSGVDGCRAEGLACTDLGARTPIGASENFNPLFSPLLFKSSEGVVRGFQIFAWAPKKHKY